MQTGNRSIKSEIILNAIKQINALLRFKMCSTNNTDHIKKTALSWKLNCGLTGVLCSLGDDVTSSHSLGLCPVLHSLPHNLLLISINPVFPQPLHTP